MQINNATSVQGIYNNYMVKQKNNPYVEKQAADVAEISQLGKDFAFTMDKLKKVEDVRTDKVQSIKEQIENGTYKVDSTKLAKAMLFGETNN